MLVERLIGASLIAELEALKKNSFRISEFAVGSLNVSTDEAESIRQAILQKPPEVIHKYPAGHSSFPLFMIVTAEGDEEIQPLGHFGGFVQEDEAPLLGGASLIGATKDSSIWQEQFLIAAVSDNPDMTLWLHAIAKLAIVRRRNAMTAAGIATERMRSKSLQPQALYLPETFSIRALILRVRSEFTVVQEPTLPIRYITGIHVYEPGTSREQIGGVSARVTPYQPGDPP